MKKIMIIGGGQWQVPIVRKAKEMGLFVINTNLYEDSPAFKYADVCEVADVLDIKRNLDIAIKYKPDAVITDQSDIAVPTVAYICEQLGLNGVGVEKAKLFTNKFLMRNFCKQYNYPTPNYSICSEIETAFEFLREYKKIVIKPLDSQSSRGVYTIENKDKLSELFEITRKFSNSENSVLVEEFIDGTEFTIDGIAINGKHKSLAISQKKHYDNYPNVASELFFSFSNPDYDYSALMNQHNRMVEEMGLSFGLTHAEYIFSKGEFYLVEVAARGGGTNISAVIVKSLSNIDSNKLLIKMALGEDCEDIFDTANLKNADKCCMLGFFDFMTGKVASISGLSDVCLNPNIDEVHLNFKVGDYVGAPTDDSKRAGHFIIHGKDIQEFNNIYSYVKKVVKVDYE